MTRREFAFSSTSLVGLCRSAARAQDEPTTFSAGVRVVNVLASVRTKRGEIVRNLGKEDFVLSENGKPQQIRYFSQETDLPLTLGLMIDTSMSQQRVLDAERRASFRFLDEVLQNRKDQSFLMQFDSNTQLRQELTSSLQKLNDALSLIDTPTRKELAAGSGDGTVLYDAVIKASNEEMKKLSDRKALILMTDGVDVGSEAGLPDAIDAAQKTDTLVYSILFADPNAYGFAFVGGTGKSALRRIAQETGGGFFEVSKKQGIEPIFDTIQQELRSEYSLGFVSDDPVRISEFRKLQLTTTRKDLIVQARDRYWAAR